MSSPYTQQVLKVIVAQVCQTIGWNSIQTTPLELLGDILHKYLQEVSQQTHRYSELYGRSEPNLDDVALAFRDLNINIADLDEYVTNVDPVPCAIDVPKYPLHKDNHLNFLKPGSKEVVTRPVHVSEHLPPMYPEKEDDEKPTTDIADDHDHDMHSGSEHADHPKREHDHIDVFSSPEPATSATACATPSSTIDATRLRTHSETEVRLTREITSVMMTTSGFISPAREGKLPDAKTPIIHQQYDTPATKPSLQAAATPASVLVMTSSSTSATPSLPPPGREPVAASATLTPLAATSPPPLVPTSGHDKLEKTGKNKKKAIDKKIAKDLFKSKVAPMGPPPPKQMPSMAEPLYPPDNSPMAAIVQQQQQIQQQQIQQNTIGKPTPTAGISCTMSVTTGKPDKKHKNKDKTADGTPKLSKKKQKKQAEKLLAQNNLNVSGQVPPMPWDHNPSPFPGINMSQPYGQFAQQQPHDIIKTERPNTPDMHKATNPLAYPNQQIANQDVPPLSPLHMLPTGTPEVPILHSPPPLTPTFGSPIRLTPVPEPPKLVTPSTEKRKNMLKRKKDQATAAASAMAAADAAAVVSAKVATDAATAAADAAAAAADAAAVAAAVTASPLNLNFNLPEMSIFPIKSESGGAPGLSGFSTPEQPLNMSMPKTPTMLSPNRMAPMPGLAALSPVGVYQHQQQLLQQHSPHLSVLLSPQQQQKMLNTMNASLSVGKVKKEPKPKKVREKKPPKPRAKKIKNGPGVAAATAEWPPVAGAGSVDIPPPLSPFASGSVGAPQKPSPSKLSAGAQRKLAAGHLPPTLGNIDESFNQFGPAAAMQRPDFMFPWQFGGGPGQPGLIPGMPLPGGPGGLMAGMGSMPGMPGVVGPGGPGLIPNASFPFLPFQMPANPHDAVTAAAAAAGNLLLPPELVPFGNFASGASGDFPRLKRARVDEVKMEGSSLMAPSAQCNVAPLVPASLRLDAMETVQIDDDDDDLQFVSTTPAPQYQSPVAVRHTAEPESSISILPATTIVPIKRPRSLSPPAATFLPLQHQQHHFADPPDATVVQQQLQPQMPAKLSVPPPIIDLDVQSISDDELPYDDDDDDDDKHDDDMDIDEPSHTFASTGVDAPLSKKDKSMLKLERKKEKELRKKDKESGTGGSKDGKVKKKKDKKDKEGKDKKSGKEKSEKRKEKEEKRRDKELKEKAKKEKKEKKRLLQSLQEGGNSSMDSAQTGFGGDLGTGSSVSQMEHTEGAVPKLTLKLGASPRPNTPDAHRKITIKPPKRDTTELDATVHQRREPSPELARFSALVTRPPKQKTPSTKKKDEDRNNYSSDLSVISSDTSFGKDPQPPPPLHQQHNIAPAATRLPSSQPPHVTIGGIPISHHPPAVLSATSAAFMSPGIGAGHLAPPMNSSTPLGPSVSAQPRKMNPPGSHGESGGKVFKQKTPKSSLMPGGVGMAGPPGCGSASATGVQDSEGNQVWICPACGRVDDGTPMIGCDGCDAWYHWVCVGIQVPPDTNEDWYCRVCIAKKQEQAGSSGDKKKKRKKKDKKDH